MSHLLLQIQKFQPRIRRDSGTQDLYTPELQVPSVIRFRPLQDSRRLLPLDLPVQLVHAEIRYLLFLPRMQAITAMKYISLYFPISISTFPARVLPTQQTVSRSMYRRATPRFQNRCWACV